MPTSSSATPITPYQRHPPPPRRGHPTRSLHISLSLLILGFFVVYAQKHQTFYKSSTTYNVNDKQLPERFAICSKDGSKVYTVPEDEGIGAKECVVVAKGIVVDTGSIGKIRRKWITSMYDQKPFNAMKIIYLPQGHTLTPGFIDSHGHPLIYGHAQQLRLHGCKSVAEVIKRVEDFVKNTPIKPGGWIEGLGWDQNLWEGKEFPTADDFKSSPILRELPISLSRVDFHVEWVSPAILRMLGDNIPDVQGGQVVRDEDGKPTGVFVDNAIDMLTAIRPPWTDEDRERYLNIMLNDAMSKGLTGVHDAQGFLKEVPFWMRVAAEGKLPIRFYQMVSCEDEDYCGDKVDHCIDEDSHFTLRAVKLFGDGALGSRGAALIDDYSDKPGWKGFMLKPEETWGPLIKQWYNAGWQVNVHTIGDHAAHVVLDAIEAAIGDELQRGREARFRMEHAQILTQEDIARAARLGVIASVQPTHATSDMWYAEDRLGPERIKGAYAWRTYLNHGGRLTLGSDFPVESIDPLKGFYAAVTRLSEDGKSPQGKGGWYAGEKLTRVEAIRGMTIDGAYASFSNSTGSLTIGRKFDAVIWDDDLMSVPDDEILEVKAKGVIVDGKMVWGSLG
uniref:Amidohydrolase n=1 Tax=Kwoniella pini CBS 10737 TaxID=1296096 RepID=A0A1B9HWT1_9TREE|nr:amidohydrolase [Kwoniella pini CBS 10737]OCF47698.1 amidohydrolase [Kwoniella pini CBS 10737]